MKPVIVIPAYQPDHRLYELVEQLTEGNDDQKIIVINDGSTTPESLSVFNSLLKIKNLDLLTHEKNKGKGEALKTGFSHYLKHDVNYCVGIVTADADGQHLSKDIRRVMEKLINAPEILWIGARKFQQKMPLRSYFGNTLTRGIFNLFFKKKLHDTQTGLRGVPNRLIEHMIHEPYSGYDFELDMLAYSSHVNIKIEEIPIEAIYIDNNISSHFKPLIDSIKIYLIFVRFSAVAVLSAVLDYSSFSLIYFLSRNLFCSVIGARFLSATFNFSMGKFVTFRSKKALGSELIKYIILATGLVLLSYCLVYVLSDKLYISVYISKIISEAFLFITSFIVQRIYIFHHAAE